MAGKAMAEIRTEGGSIYFYTSTTGDVLLTDAQAALQAAISRQGDSPYALRIVLDCLFLATGSRDRLLGSAVMLGPDEEDEFNGNKPSVIIDLLAWRVVQNTPIRRDPVTERPI
jgi:hypothetical protein